MKKILFLLKPHSIVGCITNSSSELFVGESLTKEGMIKLIEEVYPYYLNEYEEIKGIDDLDYRQLNTYFSYACSAHCWPATKDQFPVLPGFTFEELYDAEDDGKPAWNGEVQYRLKCNERYYFVTPQNFEEIKKKLDPNKQMFFLFSKDDNPDWDMQEKLEMFMERFHLG